MLDQWGGGGWLIRKLDLSDDDLKNVTKGMKSDDRRDHMRSYMQIYALALSTSSRVVSRTTVSLTYAHCLPWFETSDGDELSELEGDEGAAA